MSIRKTIDQKLIASQDESNVDASSNESFISSTMATVRAESSRETFQNVLRITDVNTKETFRMKLRKSFIKAKALPLMIVIPAVLLGTSAVGATAYVAYQWIVPKVVIKNIQDSNDDNKKQFTVDQECGNFTTGKDLKFELSQYSKLTDDEIYKVFENTCKYDAISAFIESKWTSDNDTESLAAKKAGDPITIYEYMNTFAGSAVSNPVFGLTIGQVTSIDGGQLTLALKLYRVDNTAGSYGHPEIKPFDYYPDGKEFTRTIAIASDVEVWQDGQSLSATDVKVGDTVQLVTRQVYESQDSGGQLGLGPLLRFEIAGIIKTDIDTRYLASGFNSGVGDPKIVDDITSLIPCVGFEEYSCVGSANLGGGSLYGSDMADNPDRKYLRTDIETNGLKSRSLQGRIKSIDGTRMTIQSRGKNDIFTVDLPYDVIAQHNARVASGQAGEYDAPVVEIGDLLYIVFVQADNENHLQINPQDIVFMSTIFQTKADGSRAKY